MELNLIFCNIVLNVSLNSYIFLIISILYREKVTSIILNCNYNLFLVHLKNLRTSKKIEKKEEKLTEGNQQSLATSNFFDTQGVQSPSVQMQMSPAQTSQPNQMNFNMPQTMSMPNPFGINHSIFKF